MDIRADSDDEHSVTQERDILTYINRAVTTRTRNNNI